MRAHCPESECFAESGAALGAQPVDPKAPGELPTVTAGEADLVWQEENVSMVCELLQRCMCVLQVCK